MPLSSAYILIEGPSGLTTGAPESTYRVGFLKSPIKDHIISHRAWRPPNTGRLDYLVIAKIKGGRYVYVVDLLDTFTIDDAFLIHVIRRIKNQEEEVIHFPPVEYYGYDLALDAPPITTP